MAARVYAARAASVLHGYSHKLQLHLQLVYSVLVALIATSLLDEHPWLRALRNTVCHCAAFLIGSTFEDERVAFSKRVLVKNDSYRDRLLEPEIADLVDLSEALRLSIAQRKALFQCFLRLDFMRRAGVTRTELLRYCDLRVTPLTCFLLPEAEDGATHRSGMTKRWDILQWLAVCFSVCTLEFDSVRTTVQCGLMTRYIERRAWICHSLSWYRSRLLRRVEWKWSRIPPLSHRTRPPLTSNRSSSNSCQRMTTNSIIQRLRWRN